MSKLVELLKGLGSDSELAKDFEENPEAVMKEAGLSEAEMEALQSGDVERIINQMVTGG